MSRATRLFVAFTLVGLVAALPALANDPGGLAIGALASSARIQATAELNSCAAAQGLSLEGEASVHTQTDTALAFMPIKGIGNFTRDTFVNWTTIGIFSAQGPADAEAPSGDFQVQVRADVNASIGELQIIDSTGLVVQAGDIAIDVDPDGTAPGAPVAQDTQNPLNGQAAGVDGKGYFLYYGFHCPWYYPYFAPYYYRPFIGYKHGCYNWYIRWWWGHIAFRYCWYPSRFCVHCRHHW